MDFTGNENQVKKHSNKNILFAILISLLMLLSFAGGYFMHHATQTPSVNIVTEVVDIVDKVGFVYDPTTNEYIEFDGDKVAESIANNFLDKYSAYYTKEEYTRIKEQAKGNYTAFGLQFYTELDENDKRVATNKIADISYNSPADGLGIKIGSTITAVKKGDGEKKDITNGVELTEVLSACVEGDEVEFFFDNSEEGVKIVKSKYIASYVTYCDSEKTVKFLSNEVGKSPVIKSDTENILSELKDNDKVAYIKLDAFEGNAGSQFLDVLKIMRASKRTKLILDLRDNGGGYMNILTEIASCIIPDNDGDGQLKIACSVGKEKNNNRQDNWFNTDKDRTLKDESTGKHFIEEISVLANENTASASEALIGAMLHYKDQINFGYERLVLEGASGTEIEKISTYGKGIMQTTYDLVSGGALKLTTAKIYWPDWDKKTDEGTCIQGVGIKNSKNPANCVTRSATQNSALLRAVEILTTPAVS